MSTEHYLFKEPISSVDVHIAGPHVHLSVFVNHALAGKLILREEELVPMLRALIETEPLVRQGIGKEGLYTHWYHDSRSYDPDTQVVSENGALGTLHSIGAKRQRGGGDRT